MTPSRSRLGAAIALALTATLLSACAGEDAPAPEETSNATTPTPDAPTQPEATPDPEPASTDDPTCKTLISEAVVAEFEAVGWSAQAGPLYIGSHEMSDGLQCVWANFDAPAGDHGQMFGWAEIDAGEAGDLQSELVAQGWVREEGPQGVYITESAATTVVADADGYGMTYLFGDGWVTLADTKQALEDLYLPYRQKRRTKAMIAREAGLQPLADLLLADPTKDPATAAAAFVAADKGVADVDAALEGARFILLEQFAEDAVLIGNVRKWLEQESLVVTKVAKGKETREFDGETYVMERGIFADLAIVHAWMGDTEGNLVYRKTARNFNPMMATAARVTVAQVEHLVKPGEIDPDHIHTPGIFVQRMIQVPQGYEKRIEQRTVRKREPAAAGGVA